MSSGGNGHTDTLTAALSYQAAGLSVIPVARDGSKRPDSCRLPRVTGDDGRTHATWEPFQDEPPTREIVELWFRGTRPPGIGVIGGDVSGGLETLDFDAEAETIFLAWCELVEAEAPGLVARLSIARTPKPGFHVRYRVPDMSIPGNTKLATDPAAPSDKRCLIETRGEGGYAVAPGSPAECHETGRLYEHHSGPPLEQVQAIGVEERDFLIRCAMSFDRGPPPEPPKPKTVRGPGLSPGDDYEQRGPDWPAILEAHGWVAVHHRGNATYWRRPGKEGPGWSATTGVCRSKAGRELLYVFSSNAAPFEPKRGYSKFGVYALLNHGGDFGAAAKALAAEGYGEQRGRPSSNGAARNHPASEGAPADDDRPTGEEPGKVVDEVAPAGNGDGQEAQPAGNGDIHPTDLGNARRVVKRHGADMRFVHPWKSYLVWDGMRWAEDTTGEAIRRVKETIGSLFSWVGRKIKELAEQGGDDDEDDERKAKIKQLRSLLAHLLKWEDQRAITRCLESARSEPGMPVLPEDLDRDPMLFNVLNGTIDLRTGQLRPHRREDLLTKLAPVEFDRNATCPLWERSLHRWMDGNRDLTGYLQRVVGYGLTADVSEQSLWFFYGKGANGKSTFLLTVLSLLGDYGMQAVSDLLMVKHHESHPTERADLFGKRFVATIETEEGKRMAEALMKQVTGGDPIRARKLFKDFFQFLPTHKIILAANHKPVVSGIDHAVWRRIKLVPFNVTIPDAEKDKQLPEKLKAEAPGILNWCLRGCLDWQRKGGLGEPDEVRQATAAYQSEQDVVQGFIDECCQLHPEAKANSSGLLAAYIAWSGDKLMTAPAFRKRMNDKGFESKPGTGGRYFWRGLQLKQATEEGEDSGGKWG